MANASATRDRIVDLLAPVLAGDGLDLEGVEIRRAGRRSVLRVIVDADGGVGSDLLADASHRVAELIDASDLMGAGSYTLEVTSRGVDSPLTAPRHWRRNRGRLVRVTSTDGTELTGRIQQADETGARLELSGADARDEPIRRVAYSDVVKARVQVEFGKSSPGEEEA